MSRATRHPKELCERACGSLLEHRDEYASEWEARRSVQTKLGIGSTERLRKWVLMDVYWASRAVRPATSRGRARGHTPVGPLAHDYRKNPTNRHNHRENAASDLFAILRGLDRSVLARR